MLHAAKCDKTSKKWVKLLLKTNIQQFIVRVLEAFFQMDPVRMTNVRTRCFGLGFPSSMRTFTITAATVSSKTQCISDYRYR